VYVVVVDVDIDAFFLDLEVSEYPFQLQEQGWGEFDMKIMLHFVDKSVPPYVLDHDLNFQSTHYEVPQTIVRTTMDNASDLDMCHDPWKTGTEFHT
jgi:transcription initiation factor TFIID/TFIIF subunit